MINKAWLFIPDHRYIHRRVAIDIYEWEQRYDSGGNKGLLLVGIKVRYDHLPFFLD